MSLRLPIAVLALGLAACAARQVPPPPEPAAGVAPYFPLAVGNAWTYETRFGPRVDENTVSIVAAEGRAFRDSRDNVLALDDEGLRDERRYLIRGPLRPGTAWKSIVDVGKTETYEIVATDAAVSVPAGSFDGVLLVRGKSRVDAGTELEIEWAYAPGVGLVRMRTAAVIGGKERIPQAATELVRYRVR